MTASPDPTANGATHPNPVHGKARQHTDEAILVGGDVPIAVWRLDDRDDTAPAARPGNRLASRLAQRLILVYTHLGDTIVDLDSDPHLEHASSTTSRTYLPITDPTAVADLDAPTDPISLVVLRWPPRHHLRTPASITDLFAACRHIMTTDTCAIAAVSSAAPGQPGTTHAEHLSELLPAARAAGLTPILHIVAVTAPGDHDEFLYHATQAEAEAARRYRPTGGTASSSGVDLLVFTTRSSHG
ncbi:hypothetical protein F8280_24020 [Micromonospora noduli]|uniref:hypothetical protein n=1 Tax=Micromonospora noduli TaxID=709876 RepID=UPI000DC2A3D2|nr:hypothetical protein [Micromonospora noduli]KAB1920172.1 hypothetical protein F8280_24020 [Micromonospora noduli]RAO56258.1 hypothetical protein ONO86_00771 [Micromonospora noduli]